MIVGNSNFNEEDINPFTHLPNEIVSFVTQYILDDYQTLSNAYFVNSFFKACIDEEIPPYVRRLSRLIDHLKNVSFDLSSGNRIELISDDSLNEFSYLVDQKSRTLDLPVTKIKFAASDIADLFIRSLIGTHFPQFVKKGSGRDYIGKCIEAIQLKKVKFSESAKAQEVFLKICSGLELMRSVVHDSDSLEDEYLNNLPYTKAAIFLRPYTRAENAVNALRLDLSGAFDVDAHLLFHPIEALMERMSEVGKPVETYEAIFDHLMSFHGGNSVKEIADRVISNHPKSQNNFKKAVNQHNFNRFNW